MTNKTIFVCSPFGGDDDNLALAELICEKVAYEYYYLPFAPHVYFPQFMNEFDPNQRDRGIAWGLKFMPLCDEVWIFVHDGLSAGMRREEARAIELNKTIRRIDWSNLITDKDVEIRLATKYRLWELCFAWRPVTLIDGTRAWLEPLKRTKSKQGGYYYAREA
ncbi:MAG: hypothetical protein KAS66_00175 [Candidatus Omnitrophica bacterium]|nr:hypothetical protein [Candidatus Omnitrophota bacterium]